MRLAIGRAVMRGADDHAAPGIVPSNGTGDACASCCSETGTNAGLARSAQAERTGRSRARERRSNGAMASPGTQDILHR